MMPWMSNIVPRYVALTNESKHGVLKCDHSNGTGYCAAFSNDAIQSGSNYRNVWMKYHKCEPHSIENFLFMPFLPVSGNSYLYFVTLKVHKICPFTFVDKEILLNRSSVKSCTRGCWEKISH